MHKFLSAHEVTGKSHLMRIIYNVTSKTFLNHCKDPEKPKFQLLWHTRTSVVNIGRTTICYGNGIKPWTNLLGLNDKSKAALRNRLLEVKFMNFVLKDLS